MKSSMTLAACQALDQNDPLCVLRKLFELAPGLIYLDGNSLGALPRATAQRIEETIRLHWGRDLIKSWNSAGWFELPRRVGDKIAGLIGAEPGEVLAVDSTSINLYKALWAALQISTEGAPEKKVMLSERSNFPTDLYIAQSLCAERGLVLRLVESDELDHALDDQVAVLMLTHVNYRTGSMHDMAQWTARAHAQGALCVWDLAHSAGAVPVDLHEADADFAVGCGYKYLNGGPGAPAFVWVHPRHTDRCWQPLSGWWGHEAPFRFTPDYRPAPGIGRYQCGTQPILSLVALDAGLDTFLAAMPLGGMSALRSKSLSLTDLFMQLIHERLQGHGFEVLTPVESSRRGSQVSLSTSEGAYAIVQALIDRGVIGDFRAGDGQAYPDILRFGFCPLYLSHEDVWHAVDRLHAVVASGVWREARYARQHAVT
ncbi:MAG: kynureninase [Betaproteobacteria bacterium]|nr:kynureninase [Betaproteobacteria bacterium]